MDAFGVSKNDDYYQWVSDKQMYLGAGKLVDLILTNNSKFIVVDARDEDAMGGNIKGSLHLADSSDWENTSMPKLLKEIEKKQAELVIFHCMESIRRGPRCARRLYNHVCLGYEEDKFPFSIKILQGGADRWIRKHYTNELLVENFDDDYWGWLPDESQDDGIDCPHVSYKRPSDQNVNSLGKSISK